MECSKHEKPVIGTCQWCGKALCKLDVGKAMGKKVFCKECSGELSDHIQHKQIEEMRKERESEQRQKKVSHILEKY